MKRITPYVLMLAACGAPATPAAPTSVAAQPARSTPSQATMQPTTPVSSPPAPLTAPAPSAPMTPVVYADPANASHFVTVKARLVKIENEMPMCGGIHFGTVVEYEVIAVEAGAIDSLHVMAAVGCIQMPRQSYDSNAGKLEKFEVGGIHRLTISNDVADSRGMSVMQTPSLFYVISADPA